MRTAAAAYDVRWTLWLVAFALMCRSMVCCQIFRFPAMFKVQMALHVFSVKIGGIIVMFDVYVHLVFVKTVYFGNLLVIAHGFALL